MTAETWHGTAGGYTNHKCRCDACREAARVEHLEYMHRTGRARPRAEYLAALAPMTHGGDYAYKKGCRCDACRERQRVDRARRRREGTVSVHNASGYANGCRCDVCRLANRDKKRAWRAARRLAA